MTARIPNAGGESTCIRWEHMAGRIDEHLQNETIQGSNRARDYVFPCPCPGCQLVENSFKLETLEEHYQKAMMQACLMKKRDGLRKEITADTLSEVDPGGTLTAAQLFALTPDGKRMKGVIDSYRANPTTGTYVPVANRPVAGTNLSERQTRQEAHGDGSSSDDEGSVFSEIASDDDEISDGEEPDDIDNMEIDAMVSAQRWLDMLPPGMRRYLLDESLVVSEPGGSNAWAYHEELLLKALKNAVIGYERGSPKATIVDQFKETTRSRTYPHGLSPITLMRRFKPFITQYSCSAGHDFGEEDSPCGGGDCTERRTVRSMRVGFEALFQYLMQDPVFATGVRHGPSTRRFAPDEDLMESVWHSLGMNDLHEFVRTHARGGQEGLKMNNESDLPLVLELFIDGFQPMQHGSYSLWVIMVKVVNLPHEISNDYIVPIGIIDSGGKPASLDAHIQFIVDQLLASLQGWTITTSDASRPGEVASVRLYLLCIACDMRAMKVVAKHTEALGQFPCHLCDIKGKRFCLPRHALADGRVEQRGTGTLVYDTADGDWRQKDSKRARDDAKYAGLVKERGGDVGTLRGFQDQPLWAALPYFNLAWGFLVCAMHQISNTSKSWLKYVQKMPKNDLAMWLRTDNWGQDWLHSSGYESSNGAAGLPCRSWTVNPWTRENAATAGPEANARTAHEMMRSTRTPTEYNGHARDIAHPLVPANKKHAEESAYRKIKASHWLHHAASGLLGALMYGAGVDEELCAAIIGFHVGLKQLCARVVSRQAVEKVRDDWKEAIRTFRRKVLPSEYKAALHALSHLPDQVLRYGPLPDLWSFPFEGLFAKLKPMAILNKAMPAQTMVARFEAMMGFRHVLRCFGGEGLEIPALSLRHVRTTYRGDLNGSPVRAAGSIETGGMPFIQLLRGFYDRLDLQIAQHLDDPTSIVWDISEFDTLACGGVRIQGFRSQCKESDDQHVLLYCPADGPIPFLGTVHSIFRVQLSIDGRPLEDGTGRLVLLVWREPLRQISDNERLGKCGFSSDRHPGFAYLYVPAISQDVCLVGIDEIQDQCFLVPDLVTTGGRSLVLTTGQLQNISLEDPFLSQTPPGITDMPHA